MLPGCTNMSSISLGIHAQVMLILGNKTGSRSAASLTTRSILSSVQGLAELQVKVFIPFRRREAMSKPWVGAEMSDPKKHSTLYLPIKERPCRDRDRSTCCLFCWGAVGFPAVIKWKAEMPLHVFPTLKVLFCGL